jgi:geranylgeranyl reductase family protein
MAPPHSPFTADVLVVGAGPAGTAAATTLARAGRDVTVVDKATFPRDKCCGDGLTTLALRRLEHLGLDPGAVRAWHDVEAAWLRSPSGRQVEVLLPAGRGRFAAIAPRLQLDAALVDLARASGAKVHDGHGATGVIGGDAESVTVQVDGLGPVRARYVIAADGMWSPIRRTLGFTEPGYRGEWHAFRQYASNVTGSARDQLWVWFEPDLLPGYAWSFPLPGGRANIGFGVLRDGVRRIQTMGSLWSDLLERPHVREALGPDAVMEGRHLAWPIPTRIDRATLASGRVLFVGDAAGATDPMTGEGIGQALVSGELAAGAVLRAGALDPAGARNRYVAAIHHHLITDHRMSVFVGRVLHRPFTTRAGVRAIGLNAWTRRSFARWMFEDEPRAVLVTPSRWHRRFLDQDGAWAT